MEVRQECLSGPGNKAPIRQIDMRQVDAILERFPGPVTLYVSRRRTLVGLVLCLGFAAFFVWLLFADDPETRGYLFGSYDTTMAWISIVIRARSHDGKNDSPTLLPAHIHRDPSRPIGR